LALAENVYVILPRPFRIVIYGINKLECL
jgi:hypothetical protein